MKKEKYRLRVLLCIASLFVSAASLSADHRLVTQGNGKLAIVEKDGTVSWEMPWGGIHDIHVLKNGNIMVQKQMRIISEIDVKTKKVV